MASRIHGDVYVRFRGRYAETCRRKAVRRCIPSLLATFGVFVMCKSLFRNRRPGYGLVNRLSGLSYGIYLMHIFILGFSYRLVEGLFSTPVTIVVVGCTTFVACCLLSALLSRLPGSRYLLG